MTNEKHGAIKKVLLEIFGELYSAIPSRPGEKIEATSEVAWFISDQLDAKDRECEAIIAMIQDCEAVRKLMLKKDFRKMILSKSSGPNKTMTELLLNQGKKGGAK